MSRIASREPTLVTLTAPLSRSDLLWVANTAHGAGGHWHARVQGNEPDHDHLAAPESAHRYLADHGVPVPAEQPDATALAELAIVRAMVRRRLEPGLDAWTPDGRALLASASFALGATGHIAERQPGWPGFTRTLLLPLIGLLASGIALHECANSACRLLFEDSSRNHGRRWCDTAGCGNRDRVRRARGRTGREPVATASAD